jgi:endothelin-converting enzyme/putative endopeptidase
VDARFGFRSRNFTGARELTPRWQACVHEVDGAMGMALGRAFVARWFAGDAGRATRQLVADVERAFGRNLDGLPWMDDATRAEARRKLDAIANKVGYPDAWRSYDAVKVDRRSLARSLASAAAAEKQRDLDKIGRPLDRGEWGMTPPTVNAYYDAQLNEMVFPAGILQPPFYDAAAPLPYDYGAIGYAVGHELTHGFDDEGRQFDAAGNLRDWWNPEVAKRFDARTACVVDQYSGYVAVDDVKVDGRLTLGENVADLGGVKFAWAAYKDATAGKSLPDVEGFTPDQQFFLGVGSVWCAKDRPENLRMRVKVDPHSPAVHRVNGPLSNLPAFREAFHCPAASRMVAPEGKRCEVW